MGAMGRGAMNYALTQNPLGQSFAQGMNLFSGNGQGGKGLAQSGGLSQALGLSTRDVNGKGQTIPIYVPNSAPDNGSIPQHTNLTHNVSSGKHWTGKAQK